MNLHPHPSPVHAEHDLPQGHGETILLAEDQMLMQVVTTRLLTQLGYRVLSAYTVEGAMLVWKDYQHEVAMIITDYTFNGSLTGMDLVTFMQKRAPRLPVLIVSGSWRPDSRRHATLPTNVAYLTKPYKCPELAATVHRLLDEHRPKAKDKSHRERQCSSASGSAFLGSIPGNSSD